MARRNKNSSSGCGTVVIFFLLTGFAITYLPILLAVIAIFLLVYIIYIAYKKRKKPEQENQIYVEQKNTIDTNLNKKVFKVNDIILSGGKYLGGRDISPGIYDLELISGYGSIDIDKPYSIHLTLLGNFESSYKNLEIARNSVLMIDTSIKEIVLYNKREYINQFGYNDDQAERILHSSVLDAMDGHQFEYFCADILEKQGYINVNVTKGSGDQGVDIVAERDGIKYAIQCKRYSQSVGNKAVQEIYTGKQFYHCHVGIIMTNNYFTASAKELAKENGIILWDRDYIEQYICNSEEKNMDRDSCLRIDKLQDSGEVKENDLKIACLDTDDIALKNNKKTLPEECISLSYKEEAVKRCMDEKAINFQKKKEKVIMYDKEKGIYPAGQYLVGRDIPLGEYILTARNGKTAYVELYPSYAKFKTEDNAIMYEDFTEDYHISLMEENTYLKVSDADIQRL